MLICFAEAGGSPETLPYTLTAMIMKKKKDKFTYQIFTFWNMKAYAAFCWLLECWVAVKVGSWILSSQVESQSNFAVCRVWCFSKPSKMKTLNIFNVGYWLKLLHWIMISQVYCTSKHQDDFTPKSKIDNDITHKLSSWK